MMKRLISSNSSEILKMNASELKDSIKASEGRVVLSENVAGLEPFVADISNSEIAKSCGADLILLNGVDVFNPVVYGVNRNSDNFVRDLQNLVGAPIGVNLEPIDLKADLLEGRQDIAQGRHATVATIEEIERLGMNFVCFTGNPGTGVTNQAIVEAIKLARSKFSGLIIAGKMHSSGTSGTILDLHTVEQFILAGADVILAPAVGTVPGFNDRDLSEIVKYAHEQDTLVMSAIGTSQESSDANVVSDIAIRNKVCGVDIQHIGDAGYAGIAPVQNIFALSCAIRGVRHTISRVARSINR